MSKRPLGWIPDVPDVRDLTFSIKKSEKVKVAKVISLSLKGGCSPVEDQLSLGSCVAQSVVGMFEFLYIKNKKKVVDFSRLFEYYNARVFQGTVLSDSGSSIRNGIKAAVHMGICLESKYPYDIKKFASIPPPSCYREALSCQAVVYERINNLDEMKACICLGYPFVGGVSVYDSFMSKTTACTGKITMPKDGEKLLGGHAIMFVGFSDRTRRFLFRNSWGVGWGNKGYGTIPYSYLDNNNLCADFWTIKEVE